MKVSMIALAVGAMMVMGINTSEASCESHPFLMMVYVERLSSLYPTVVNAENLDVEAKSTQPMSLAVLLEVLLALNNIPKELRAFVLSSSL